MSRGLCLFFLFALNSFSIAFISCGGCERQRLGGSSSVIIEQVRVQQSSPTITVPGILIPRDKVEVKAAAPARISEVLVGKGDIVKEGTVLAKLSEEEVTLRVNQLRAAKKDAEATAEKNQYLLKNRDKMLEEGKIDKTQYDSIGIEAASSESSLERIKADLAVAEYNLAHQQIISPINGVITEKYASPAQNVSENQVLFVIVNIDPILVSFTLTSDESSGIKLGMPINVRVEDTGRDYRGTVSYIGPVVSQPAMTFDVWASIPNPDYALKGGMQATAEFTSTNIHKIIVVPSTAIMNRDRDKFVFTVKGGIAHETKVGVRNIRSDYAEISKGLAENDLVVVKGANGLQDGATVEMWNR